MTTRFVDNFTPGSNTSPYDTWAKAATTAAAVDAVDAAGEVWYFNKFHSDLSASAQTFNLAGTPSSLTQWLSVTLSGATGNSGLALGASIITSGASSITVNGSVFASGMVLAAGSGSSSANVTLGNADTNVQVWESCTFTLGSTNSNNRILLCPSGTNADGAVTLRNATLKFSNTAQGISLRHGYTKIEGGSVDGSGSAITTFIAATQDTSRLLVSGFDFSNAATALNLVAGVQGVGLFVFRYCKMPTSWSGDIFASDPSNPGVRGEMHGCNDGTDVLQTRARDYAGSQLMEKTIVRTGGSTINGTAVSWKITTTANASFPAVPFGTIEIALPNTTTGSSQTLTIEFEHDSATALTNADIWPEVLYLGSSSSTLGTVATGRAGVLDTPTAWSSSSETWTTTGQTNPNAQKMTLTFTPQIAGGVVVRVCVAKASKTVYLDIKPTLGASLGGLRQIPGGPLVVESASGGGGSVALPPLRIAA